jgi:predicted YcjX-like family ATPase
MSRRRFKHVIEPRTDGGLSGMCRLGITGAFSRIGKPSFLVHLTHLLLPSPRYSGERGWG